MKKKTTKIISEYLLLITSGNRRRLNDDYGVRIWSVWEKMVTFLPVTVAATTATRTKKRAKPQTMVSLSVDVVKISSVGFFLFMSVLVNNIVYTRRSPPSFGTYQRVGRLDSNWGGSRGGS